MHLSGYLSLDLKLFRAVTHNQHTNYLYQPTANSEKTILIRLIFVTCFILSILELVFAISFLDKNFLNVSPVLCSLTYERFYLWVLLKLFVLILK